MIEDPTATQLQLGALLAGAFGQGARFVCQLLPELYRLTPPALPPEKRLELAVAKTLAALPSGLAEDPAFQSIVQQGIAEATAAAFPADAPRA